MHLFKFLFFCFAACLYGQKSDEVPDRLPYPPYITGDAFRHYCDFIVDETNQFLIPEYVPDGSTIFVNTDYLTFFFKNYHPQIQSKYILVTHNHDHHVPGPFAEFLDDEKIIAWFGQNADEIAHPKLRLLPIGINNRYSPNSDHSLIDRIKRGKKNAPRNTLLYMNFYKENTVERRWVYEWFRDKPFCKNLLDNPYPQRTYPAYLQDVAQSKFVLSPWSNGDCVRTWESLYMGAIPIVRSNLCDKMYDGLPVVIVHGWTEVTEEFLLKKYEEMSQQTYHLERLDVAYWINQIEECKQQFLKSI